MRKIFALALIGLFAFSCSTNDEESMDCSLYDPAFPELYLRLVDESGNNLIENGTIDPDNITVDGNFSNPGFHIIPENELANPDADIRKFDNTLLLFIPNKSTFRYTVKLNDSDSIDINFIAESTNIECGLSYFKPIGAEYDGVPIELTEVAPLQFLLVLELE